MQRRFSSKTHFEFGEDTVSYILTDSSGSRSSSFEYAEFSQGTTEIETKNSWWRNAGLLWCIIGGAQILLVYVQKGQLRGSFWLLLGLGCLAVYYLGRTRSSVHETGQGRLYIIKDSKHDRILNELIARRKSQLLRRYGAIDMRNDPEREIAKFHWLVEQGALSAEDRDKMVAAVRAARGSVADSDEQGSTIN